MSDDKKGNMNEMNVKFLLSLFPFLVWGQNWQLKNFSFWFWRQKLKILFFTFWFFFKWMNKWNTDYSVPLECLYFRFLSFIIWHICRYICKDLISAVVLAWLIYVLVHWYEFSSFSSKISPERKVTLGALHQTPSPVMSVMEPVVQKKSCPRWDKLDFVSQESLWGLLT